MLLKESGNVCRSEHDGEGGKQENKLFGHWAAQEGEGRKDQEQLGMEGTGRGWPTAGTSGSHWEDRGGGKETVQNEGGKCAKPKITGVKAKVWDRGRAGR